MDINSQPVYRVRSRQPIEELERRGLPAVRMGEECVQDREPGFEVHAGVMVYVRFLSDGAACCLPKNYLRRASA